MKGENPPSGDEDSSLQISRRRFAESAAGVGLFGMGADEILGTPERTRRVPKYLRGDTVVETMKVPRRWLAQHDAAQSALETLNREYMDHSAVMETGLVSGDQTIGGKRGFKIEAVVDRDQPDPGLPSSVSGISVTVDRRTSDFRAHTTCDNQANYENYRGGVICADDTGYGTSGYRVKYNGSEYMLTALHVFGDCGWTQGDTTYQDSEQLGEIESGDIGGDWVITDASASNTTIKNEILEPDGTKRTIDGHASETEIANRVSDSFDGYTKVGVTTGETTGGLGKKDITTDDCTDLHGEGVRGSADQAAGDSGCPAYSVENGDAFMLFHATYGVNKKGSITCNGNSLTEYNKSLGIGAYYVNNQGYEIAT